MSLTFLHDHLAGSDGSLWTPSAGCIFPRNTWPLTRKAHGWGGGRVNNGGSVITVEETMILLRTHHCTGTSCWEYCCLFYFRWCSNLFEYNKTAMSDGIMHNIQKSTLMGSRSCVATNTKVNHNATWWWSGWLCRHSLFHYNLIGKCMCFVQRMWSLLLDHSFITVLCLLTLCSYMQ